MLSFDPGKPGIIMRLRGDKWLTSEHPDCGVNGAGVGGGNSDSGSRVQISDKDYVASKCIFLSYSIKSYFLV